MLIFSVDRPDVFPLNPLGVYHELWCSLPGQPLSQCPQGVGAPEGCAISPILADVWGAVLGK